MRRWWLLAVAITFEVTATLALKGALERPSLYALVIVGYLTAFVCLAAILRSGGKLGVVYGLWAAMGVAGTALLSSVIFDERLTGTMVVGLAVIIAGVLLVEFSSHRAHASEIARVG